MWKKYLIEFMGTMFLVLICSMVGNPLAIGSMLVVLSYMGLQISGSHFNPAVSVAMWMKNKLSSRDMWFYVLAQILGGFVAACFYLMLVHNCYYPTPAPGVGYWKIVLVELVFTFFYVSAFIAIANSDRLKSSNLNGLIIGLALLPIAFLGGTYNPAISVGPSFLGLLFGEMAIKHVPAYLVGTLAGASVAALFHTYVYEKEF